MGRRLPAQWRPRERGSLVAWHSAHASFGQRHELTTSLPHGHPRLWRQYQDSLWREVLIQRWLLEAGVEGEVLRDDQWARLEPFVPGGRKGKRGPRSNGRRFLDAVLWLARSGARWRDLPEDRFGPYQTVKRRYYRWIEAGVFDRIFEAVAADRDLEWLSIDATVIRAHAQAASGRRKRGDRKPRLSAARAAASEASSTQ